jgi:hypothetical protein
VSDLALDPVTGDLVLEAGDAVLCHGVAAIAQDWSLRMRLFRGEWPLDRRVGIDYQRLVFDARPSDALLRHIFESVTRETAGVRSVERLEFSLDRRSRQLTVTATATSIAGEPLALSYRDVLFADDDARDAGDPQVQP